MAIIRKDFGIDTQSANSDYQIGKRQDFAGTVHPPGEFFGCSPSPVIKLDVRKEIKKIMEIIPRWWGNNPAQHLATDEIANHQLPTVESAHQGFDWIDPETLESDVNR